MASEIYKGALAKDDTLREQIEYAKERVKAYPEDVEANETLVKACVELTEMWEGCENDLRQADAASSDLKEKRIFVKEINLAHEAAIDAMAAQLSAKNNMLQNTSKLYRFGQSMAQSGRAMKETGNAMQRTGIAMFKGCSLPIIIVFILLLLLMLL